MLVRLNIIVMRLLRTKLLMISNSNTTTILITRRQQLAVSRQVVNTMLMIVIGIVSLMLLNLNIMRTNIFGRMLLIFPRRSTRVVQVSDRLLQRRIPVEQCRKRERNVI